MAAPPRRSPLAVRENRTLIPNERGCLPRYRDGRLAARRGGGDCRAGRVQGGGDEWTASHGGDRGRGRGCPADPAGQAQCPGRGDVRGLVTRASGSSPSPASARWCYPARDRTSARAWTSARSRRCVTASGSASRSTCPQATGRRGHRAARRARLDRDPRPGHRGRDRECPGRRTADRARRRHPDRRAGREDVGA